MDSNELPKLKRKTRNKILIIFGIIILGLVLYFKPFSSTEIIILHHMTEVNKEDGVVDQICLVKNPPYFSSTLEVKIDEFDVSNPVKGRYYRRLFIKEHDYIFFPSLFMQENIDYESAISSRENLDNIDFLANSTFQKTENGSVIREIYIRTGEFWYYKD